MIENADTVVAVRGSCGQAEIWSAGSKHQFTALKAAPGDQTGGRVKPAKNRRRQRTATPILATTPRPAQPLPAGTTPARRAARAAANPSPRRRASPAQFSRHTASPGHLRLVVDWVPSRPERPEGLIMVYDGGVLAPGEVAAITTQDGELAGYAFVKADEVAERVSPLLARRIAACVDAVRAGTVISLEDGCPVT